MEPVGRRDIGVPDGLAEEDFCLLVSKTHGSYEELEPIDWAAAAPSWASIVGGIAWPVAAIIALVFLIDVVLCWVFGQLIGHFWTVPFWLLATLVFPVALIGTIAVAEPFLKISNGVWIATKSKELL
jgi:hypothetical protein